MAPRSVPGATPRRAKGDQGTPIEPQRGPQVRPRGGRVQPKGDPGDQKSLKSGPRGPIDGKVIRTVRPRRAPLEKNWKINRNHCTVDRFFCNYGYRTTFFPTFLGQLRTVCYVLGCKNSGRSDTGWVGVKRGGRGYILIGSRDGGWGAGAGFKNDPTKMKFSE